MLDNILYYINSNYNKDIDLNSLAEEANYSPYHFHRLFKQKTGEAPKQYIQRLRLEKACKDLIFYADKSIYEIALDCGFSSPSVFARAFKKRFNVSAEEYRRLEHNKEQEKKHALLVDSRKHIEVMKIEPFTIIAEMVLLENLDSIINAFKIIWQWAEARDLLSEQKEFYGVWLDSPITTDINKCRYLTGIKIKEPTVDSTKKWIQLGGERYGVIRLNGDIHQLTDQALYLKKKWITNSGYRVKQDVLGFEFFENVDFTKTYPEHFRKVFIALEAK